jgi:hypothetical protein
MSDYDNETFDYSNKRSNKMNEEEKSWMGKAMEVYGGGFVRSLYECMCHADSHNFQRLVDAFPEIIEQYSKMGKIMKDREETK